MRRHGPQPDARPPWSAPVAVREVPEAGRHVRLVADEATRAAVAHAIGLRALPRLEAIFDVSRQGRDGLHVAGRVSATVGQTCVVTLEPVDNEFDEAVDLAFAPVPEEAKHDKGAGSGAGKGADKGTAKGVQVAADDGPEPLIGGVVDLGVIATEFLTLGLDPYPRKPGAEFTVPAIDDNSPHPFAALAALKKGEGGS